MTITQYVYYSFLIVTFFYGFELCGMQKEKDIQTHVADSRGKLVQFLKQIGKESVLDEIDGEDFKVDARLTPSRETLLHLATKFGVTDLVKKLVFEKNASVDIKNMQGTHLHLACRWGHEAIIRFLLDNGADSTLTGIITGGRFILHYIMAILSLYHCCLL